MTSSPVIVGGRVGGELGHHLVPGRDAAARRGDEPCRVQAAVARGVVEGLDDDDFVFTLKGKKVDSNKVCWLLKKACKAAKVPYGDKTYNAKGEKIGIVFHCLRHTRTSKWVEAGYSDEVIRRATGHASMSAYRHYIKLDPTVVTRLVEKWDKNGIKSPQTSAVGGK